MDSLHNIIMFNSEKFILIEGSTQHSCYDIQIVYFVVHGINKSKLIILSLYKQYYENDGSYWWAYKV